jgi:hypothetical protein
MKNRKSKMLSKLNKIILSCYNFLFIKTKLGYILIGFNIGMILVWILS